MYPGWSRSTVVYPGWSRDVTAAPGLVQERVVYPGWSRSGWCTQAVLHRPVYPAYPACTAPPCVPCLYCTLLGYWYRARTQCAGQCADWEAGDLARLPQESLVIPVE